MQPLSNDATTALLRGLRKMFPGCSLAFDEIASRAWASVTFVGARHRLRFGVSGEGADEAADRFVAGLEAAEFSLRGHLVADVVLLADERSDGGAVRRIEIEALTVEDG